MKRAIGVLLLFFVFIVTNCADKERVDNLEKTQEEILARLKSLEENQKKILGLFQPRRPVIDFDRAYNIPIGNSPIKGNKGAPVTIVEFSDYECPYCAALQPTLRGVLKAYPQEVKLVFKNFPLSFHKQARNAAKAALAAGEQGKFWEMHDIIFENYDRLSEEKFIEFARRIGLDVEKFIADYKSNKYDKQIQQDIELGISVGVRGTPTLFINGKRMRGRSFNHFKEAIERILKEKSS